MSLDFDTIMAWPDHRESQERLPVTRVGERDPISPWIRRLVHRRDGYKCLYCGWTPFEQRKRVGTFGGMLHVDHIVPWSAGGSDRTDNLRTLCEHCNEERSNKRTDSKTATAMPIARICDLCSGRWVHDGHPPEATTVYCASRHHVGWVVDTRGIL